jgi:hypothetical protein
VLPIPNLWAADWLMALNTLMALYGLMALDGLMALYRLMALKLHRNFRKMVKKGLVQHISPRRRCRSMAPKRLEKEFKCETGLCLY